MEPEQGLLQEPVRVRTGRDALCLPEDPGKVPQGGVDQQIRTALAADLGQEVGEDKVSGFPAVGRCLNHRAPVGVESDADGLVAVVPYSEVGGAGAPLRAALAHGPEDAEHQESQCLLIAAVAQLLGGLSQLQGQSFPGSLVGACSRIRVMRSSSICVACWYLLPEGLATLT